MNTPLRCAVIAVLLPLLAACDAVDNEPVAGSGQTLCLSDYEMCVNPIFDAVINSNTGQTTCSASGCHDLNVGSGGAFKINPLAAPASAEMLANFFSAKAFANLDNPGLSKLLLEPLQGSSSITGTHTGGDIFTTTADACYQAVHSWISNRVEDREAAVCGTCTVPDIAACGF